MPTDDCYCYPNHSDWWRAIRAYYRSRGVVSANKVNELAFKWQRRKGYRMPSTVNGESHG